MDLYPLLLAFQQIVSKYAQSDVVLLLGGATGENNLYLLNLAKRAGEMGLQRNLLFNFNFSEDIKHLLYSACDIFVSIPDNVQETFGITPVEAMMSEKPAVISDWSGYRELVDDGVTGYLVPTYWSPCDERISPTAFYRPLESHFYLAQSVAVDIDVLADRLNRLIDDAECRRRMGRAARRKAVESYSASSVINRYVELWAELKSAADASTRGGAAEGSGFLPYYEVFHHYASHILSDSSRVSVTEAGLAVSRRESEPFVYELLEDKLDPDLIYEILKIAEEPVSVKTIKESVSAGDSRFNYGLMWLIKQNLIRVLHG